MYNVNNDEYSITFDKSIDDGDYSIQLADKSKSIEVYSND
jgi:hypothetical protein